MLEYDGLNIRLAEVLNYLLTTQAIEEAARYAHDIWRAGKHMALEDPENPYRGYGPVRIKVRDLPEDERAALGNVDPGLDVFHPLDVPFDELPGDGQNKNVLPLVFMCYSIGDVVSPPDADIAWLEATLAKFVEGDDQSLNEILGKLAHLGFMSSEVRVGARPFGDNARDDFPLYQSLSEPVQRLDIDAMRSSAEWMLEQLHNPACVGFLAGWIAMKLYLAGEERVVFSDEFYSRHYR
jgi:hypothetical protein